MEALRADLGLLEKAKKGLGERALRYAADGEEEGVVAEPDESVRGAELRTHQHVSFLELFNDPTHVAGINVNASLRTKLL